MDLLGKAETPSQVLVNRLKVVIKAINKEVLTEDTGPLADALVTILETITKGEIIGLVLVALGDITLAELMISGLPPSGIFELSGRLQALAVKLSMIATHTEMHDDVDDDDHTGHGCEYDPKVKDKITN